MTLSNFNSYFEILVGLNLGYAVFDYFRKELASRIFRIPRFTERLINLKSRLDTQLTEIEEDSELFTHLNKIKYNVDIKTEILDIAEEKERNFFEVLKPISFLLALLSISYLIIAGFQDEKSLALQPYYSDYFLNLTCYSSIFSFAIFYSTFSDRIVEYKLKLTPLQIILTFVIFSSISCSLINSFISQSLFFKTINFIFIPSILFSIFILFNLSNIEKYKKRKVLETLSCFLKLCYANFKPTIGYLIIILIGLIPIFLYLYYPNLNFINYLITLVTPLLLFVFIAIRVYFHARKFTSMYKKLSVEQTIILDNVLD